MEFRFESDPLFDVEPIYLGDSVVPLRLDIGDFDSLRADSLRFRIFAWICEVLRAGVPESFFGSCALQSIEHMFGLKLKSLM